jgi:hypothetical protein
MAEEVATSALEGRQAIVGGNSSTLREREGGRERARERERCLWPLPCLAPRPQPTSFCLKHACFSSLLSLSLSLLFSLSLSFSLYGHSLTRVANSPRFGTASWRLAALTCHWTSRNWKRSSRLGDSLPLLLLLLLLLLLSSSLCCCFSSPFALAHSAAAALCNCSVSFSVVSTVVVVALSLSKPAVEMDRAAVADAATRQIGNCSFLVVYYLFCLFIRSPISE